MDEEDMMLTIDESLRDEDDIPVYFDEAADSAL
jgi:hypothetical protein